VTTYVLVHGAWQGGWCWQSVALPLEAAGHHVLTPTLTGLGDRRDELTPDVGLAHHVGDIVDLVRSFALTDVVLVGHSYAGMVVTGAAGVLGGLVARLVVVDGFLPERGERAVELLPDGPASYYRDSAAGGDGWTVPPKPLQGLGVTDPAVLAAHRRMTPHPYKTYTDPSEHGVSDLDVAGTYLLCAGWPSPFGPHARRAGEHGWDVRYIDADHQVVQTDPRLLVEQLG
jgi:pimeloyl-ACP methyl ester carboxylesterase